MSVMRLKFRSFSASFWARGFLRNCRREMKPVVDDVRSVERDIRRRAQALFDERARSLPDKQARVITAMCSLVLAAYRSLGDQAREPEAAFETVRRAFARTYPAPMTWTVRLWLLGHRDPVANLRGRSFEKMGQRMYGKSMEFAGESGQDSVTMLVVRCAFHQFFVEHGAGELTPLVCAWDRAWMDAIDRSSRPIRTERPSTISTGGDCCRFRFVRDADKQGQDPNDVVLVQLQSRAGA
jgi:hypothetical protein